MTKSVNAGVFKVAANHTANSHVGLRRGTRAQTADAANNEINLYSCVARTIESLDDLYISNRVDFDCDASVGAKARFVVNKSAYRRTKMLWGDDQFFVALVMAVSGQMVKQMRDVISDLRIAREESDVFVHPRCFGVVIASTNVGVSANTIIVVAHNKHTLAVYFQTCHAIDNMYSCTFECFCPCHIDCFVKARFKFD